jgi:hypothetical protein
VGVSGLEPGRLPVVLLTMELHACHYCKLKMFNPNTYDLNMLG